MKVHTKEIGIGLGFEKGKHFNTEFLNGKLQLKEIGINSIGKTIYADNGYWVSDVINLVDNFMKYDHIALKKEQMATDKYLIKTQTSDDGVNFSDFTDTLPDGTIISLKKQFIRVKIELAAGFGEEELRVSDFDSTSSDKYANHDFLNINGKLLLKKTFDVTMNENSSWNEAGKVFTSRVNNGNFKKINLIKDSISPTASKKMMIFHKGEYKKFHQGNWATVSTSLPNHSSFLNNGHDIISFDRKETNFSFPLNSSSLGGGKIFKCNINLQNLIDIKNFNIK